MAIIHWKQRIVKGVFTMKEKISREKEQIMLLTMGFLLLAVGMFSSQGEPEHLTRGDFIRFHVIANSNEEADQALKLEVRDEILAQIAPELNQMDSMTHTREYIRENMDKIAAIAEGVISEQGFSYGVETDLGLRWIPEKTYGQITFPQGTYEAFTVTLGEGAGENWWCVMFPPLCLIDEAAEKDAALEPGEFISEKYELLMESKEQGKPLTLKFKSAEIAEDVLDLIFLHLV